MPRHTEVIDPIVAAELAELEAALAATPSAREDLVALVADVRAEAPAPRMAFRADLDRRVAAGFTPDGGAAARWSAVKSGIASRRGMLLPAMGVATTLIVALVVVGSSLHHSGSGAVNLHSEAVDAVGGAAGGPSRPVAAPEKQAAGTAAPTIDSARAPAPSTQSDKLAAPAFAAPSSGTVRGFARKVERSTQIQLTTTPGKLQDAADGVVRATQSAGGVVESSQVDSSDDGGTATFRLSVPSDRLAEVTKNLSALAHVSSLSNSSDDITNSFVSAASKLSDARAERKALLKALGVATTPERIATLRARLRNNRSEIAVYNGQLRSLRSRTNNTKIDVTIDGSASAPSHGSGWSAGRAGRDALHVLEVVASVLLISAAILVPLGLLGALMALTMRSTRGRRREQALDSQ